MHAFPAAKRTILLIAGLALFGLAFSAVAEKEHGYLGVMLQDVSPSMAKALQMEQDSGVMINEVVEDSPAEKAGLEDGDVILEFNGKSIKDHAGLTKAVRKTEPGDKVNVVVLRNGKKQTVEVEVGENDNKWVFSGSGMHNEWVGKDDNVFFSGPGKGHSQVWVSEDGHGLENVFFDSDRGYMGIHLDDLNEQMGEYFGVKDGEGALITEVVEDSPAAKAGLKAGDIVVKIGDEKIDSAGEVHEALAETEAEQVVRVQVIRKGSSKNLDVTLGEAPEDENIKVITRTMRTPHMMKHFAPHADMDVRVMRHGAPDVEVLEFHSEAEEELEEMREELDKMREELDALRDELKK